MTDAESGKESCVAGPPLAGSVPTLGERLNPSMIAVDGPAASGKSTVGYQLAQVVRYLYFDTGVMYRAVTLAALAEGLDIRDGQSVGALAERLPLSVEAADAIQVGARRSTVLVAGRDVTAEIRSAQVDRYVSAVSAHAHVRAALTRHQRRIGQQYGSGRGDLAGVVMVGRDIGTVVIPEAPIKVFLDATPEERARRRFQELAQKGVEVEYVDILSDINRRDKIDSSRSLAPLQVAEDAWVIDTTELAIDEVVERIVVILAQTVAAQAAG